MGICFSEQNLYCWQISIEKMVESFNLVNFNTKLNIHGFPLKIEMIQVIP